jgi:hypothetical protein
VLSDSLYTSGHCMADHVHNGEIKTALKATAVQQPLFAEYGP